MTTPLNVETPPNPMDEARPDSLTELFSRDPLELSSRDIETIVVELRRQRLKWLEAEAKGAKRAPGVKAAPKATAPKALKLDDLGL